MSNMLNRSFFLSLVCLLTLSLSGCGSVDNGAADAALAEKDPLEASREARNLPALLDAPNKSVLVCHSTQPLSVHTPFKSILFECTEPQAQATIDELRDAGWRMESADIGKPENIDGVVGMTLQITLKKIF